MRTGASVLLLVCVLGAYRAAAADDDDSSEHADTQTAGRQSPGGSNSTSRSVWKKCECGQCDEGPTCESFCKINCYRNDENRVASCFACGNCIDPYDDCALYCLRMCHVDMHCRDCQYCDSVLCKKFCKSKCV